MLPHLNKLKSENTGSLYETVERLELDGFNTFLKNEQNECSEMFSNLMKSNTSHKCSHPVWEIASSATGNPDESFYYNDEHGPVKIPVKLYLDPTDTTDFTPEFAVNLSNDFESLSHYKGVIKVGNLAGSPATISYWTNIVRHVPVRFNLREGRGEADEDACLSRFTTKMKQITRMDQQNLYSTKMHMAVVTVDFHKASHRMRACGSALFLPEKSEAGEKTIETNKEASQQAVEYVIQTCPFLDIQREISGAPPYKSLWQRLRDEQMNI
jgi:hypothetical protein